MLSLADRLAARDKSEPALVGPSGAFSLSGLTDLSEIGSGEALALSIVDPISLIRILLQLDGYVERMLLLSSALPAEQAADILGAERISKIITDRSDLGDLAVTVSPEDAIRQFRGTRQNTEWMLTTSGTTGIPKRIRHSLSSLCRTVAKKSVSPLPHWGLLYDPTRFAGLQVVLQALIGGGILIAPDIHAPITEQISYLSEQRCTHLSATPSLWRRILMAPGHQDLNLRQVTLGGEIVDQPMLDRLHNAYPNSRITHIYASTEAGVGFSVTDGREGFPRAYFDGGLDGTQMRLKEGILWLKPEVSNDAQRQSPQPSIEMDSEGFIRSGDAIELRDDRAIFLGRDSGIINVGGVKVHPEAVERVLLDVSGIEQVQIIAKSSPISGALVTAQIVIRDGVDPSTLKAEALEHCRAHLPREAVPALLKVVSEFKTNSAGKLIRQ